MIARVVIERGVAAESTNSCSIPTLASNSKQGAFNPRNEANRQPLLNFHVVKAYVVGAGRAMVTDYFKRSATLFSSAW